jgi:hypothetical protein
VVASTDDRHLWLKVDHDVIFEDEATRRGRERNALEIHFAPRTESLEGS